MQPPYDSDSDSDYSSAYRKKQFTGRLKRSLENPLRLLHRSNFDFFILGATGKVYTVTLSTTPTCNCPDPVTPCKHILFLYIRVFSLSTTDPCLRRKTLQPCELTRLLSAEVSDEALAGPVITERFHEKYRQWIANRSTVSVEEGCKCGICLEKMGADDRKVVACCACKKPVHEKCLKDRKREWSWEEIWGEYINLSAYLSEDDYEDYDDDDDDDDD